MRKYLFLLVLFVAFVIGGGFLWFYSSKVTLYTEETGIFYQMADDLVEELNKQGSFGNKKVDFYVANFGDNKIPDIKNEKHFNVLFLGSRRGFNIEAVRGFDKVYASTHDLVVYLESVGVESEFMPISWHAKGSIADIKDKTKWLFIGNNEDTETILEKQGIQYDKVLSFAEDKAILHKLDEIKGVIIDDYMFSNDSIDYSPLVLEILARKIPIVTNQSALGVYFNDVLSYYNYESVEFALNNLADVDEAYKFYQDYYSTFQVVKRISNTLNSEKSEVLSIRHSTYAGLYNNGDYWITKDLIKAINNIGVKTYSYFYDSALFDIGNVDIFVRGIITARKSNNHHRIALMYLLFPAHVLSDEKVLSEDIYFVDAVVVASQKFVDFLKQKNVRAYYISQFTNPERFYPSYDETLKSEILFVGNHYTKRIAPETALKNNLPITIYGAEWGNVAKASFVDNEKLHKYYSSAKINLNDHREDMREWGFINNRVFDVTASGGFLISDYLPEIEEIYGDSIPMWKTEEELVALLKYYLNPEHEAERLEKAAKAREITLKNFTADIVAKKFEALIEELKKEKGL